MILRAVLVVVQSCHAVHVKGGDPDKKGYPGPTGWGLVAWLLHPIKK